MGSRYIQYCSQSCLLGTAWALYVVACHAENSMDLLAQEIMQAINFTELELPISYKELVGTIFQFSRWRLTRF